jgi:hypothetical protein
VGRASRRKKKPKQPRKKERKLPPGGDEGRGGDSGYARITMFTDVHPQGRINARFLVQMMEILSETTLSSEEQQQATHRSLLPVANKLATTWRHLARYQGIEANLLATARKNPLQRVMPVSHDPELYRACDDFLIQLRDGLNHVWRFPAEFYEHWPLTCMPESVDAARESIGKMIEERRAKSAQSLLQALEDHRPWVEDVVSKAGQGINHLVFKVSVAAPESGTPGEYVPMWSQAVSVNKVMSEL